MYIQYSGFEGAVASRIYRFHVIDERHERREFTVGIQSEAFGPSRLGLQDGPDICFALLKKALEAETLETRAEGHLNIGDEDVRAYLAIRAAAQASGKGKRERLAAEQNEPSDPSLHFKQSV